MVNISESPSEIWAIVRQCSSPRRAIEWFLQYIIADNVPQCSRCRILMSVVRLSGVPIRWRCHRCRKSLTIFHGTIFEGKRTPFHKVLLALLLIYLQIPQMTVRYLCAISRPTISYYERITRIISLVDSTQIQVRLGGPGIRVQIDEALLRKRKYKRGKQKPQIWIFGVIQEGSREDQRLFLKRVKTRSASELIPLIQAVILPGSTIISDEWRAYRGLSKLGFTHKTVNHSEAFRNEDGDNTNLIEGIWSHLRRSLPISGVKKHLIDQYLARFTIAYNAKRGFIDFFRTTTYFDDSNIVEIDHDSLSETSSDSGDAFEDLAIPNSHSDSSESTDVDPLGAGTGESSSEYHDEE